MLWTNTKRIIKSGFENFWRNSFISFATVLILTVTLFTIGSVIFVIRGLNASMAEIRDKVDINVYLLTSASEADALSLKKSVEALPEVSRVEYISREIALENFKKRHENDELIFQALSELGSNPLGAVLNIKAGDPSQYEGIANFLKSDNAISKDKSVIIDKINYYDNKTVVERLTKVIRAVEKFGLAVTIILILISLIIAFNTIRLIIYTAREEISVMRLVGASNKYIRGPFVVSGILYGLTAGFLTMVIFYPLTFWLREESADFFSGVNFYAYYISHFGELAAIIVGSGILLGAVSSFFAVKRYLKI